MESKPDNGAAWPPVSETLLFLDWSNRPLLVRVGIGMLFAVAAAAFRWLLLPLTGAGAPFVVFFGMVLASSAVGGIAAGTSNAVFGGALASYFFISRSHFSVSQVMSQYILFIAEGALIGFVTEGFFSSRRQSQNHVEALRRSDERYQLALRATSDLIWDWRSSGDKLDFSEGMSTALGYPKEFLQGSRKWWLGRVHGDDAKRVERSLQLAFARRDNRWTQEYRFLRHDGSLVDILDKGYILYDKQGRVVRMIGAMQNITQRRNDQRILREAQDKLTLVTDSLPALIAYIDAEGRHTFMNAEWERWFGRSREELSRRRTEDILLGDEHEGSKLPEAIEQTLSGETVRFEKNLTHPVRGDVPTSFTLVPDFDEKRRVRGYITLAQDISERKKAEQELRALANYIPQLAWIADTRGDVYWVNQRWFDYTGACFEAMAKRAWLQLVQESHQQRVGRELEHAFSSGLAFEGTFPIRSKDGEQRWFLTRAIPIFNEDGGLSRWFGTSTDINDQLEVQTRLVSAQKQLETAVQARDEFMSIASHELKTPLTSLQLIAQMAQRNLRTNPARACEVPRVEKLVMQTERSVERLTRLVDDMLDSSRIAMGKLSFKIEQFDLSDLVSEVVDRMGPQVQANGGQIRVDAKKGAIGRWDRFRIEQVVTNLLTNAMRYGAGSPIEVAVDGNEDAAWFRVRDHGPGIAKLHQDRIFQQYERATPHSSISGLGLGLFICKEIVARHGGTIALQSDPGDGAEFCVRLPLTSESERQASR